MDEKTYKNLLIIKEDLIIDNNRIDIKLESLYLEKNNIKTIINKIYSLTVSKKISNDKIEGIILTSLLTTLCIFYEIITIGQDNGITKNNLPIVSITPIVSSSLSYLSFLSYKKNKKFIEKNPLNELEKKLENTNNRINNLIDRKITNQKILNNIEKNLNTEQKTYSKTLTKR